MSNPIKYGELSDDTLIELANICFEERALTLWESEFLENIIEAATLTDGQATKLVDVLNQHHVEP
jgi:hypothetical protein